MFFDPNHSLFFHVKDGKVEQISTSIADYESLSNNRSMPLFSMYMILAICCTGYLLISPFVLLVTGIKNRRKKQSVSIVGKWNRILILTGTAMVLNNLLLISRMLVNSLRSYSEIVLHILLNYGLTVVCLVSFGFILGNWRKSTITQLKKFFYDFVVSGGRDSYLFT